MVVVIEVVTEAGDRPTRGAPVHVEIRDVGMADAAALTVGKAKTMVRQRDSLVATAKIDVSVMPRHAAVWVHIDVDRDGRVSTGDFITVQRFPVPPGPSPHVRVSVRRV